MELEISINHKDHWCFLVFPLFAVERFPDELAVSVGWLDLLIRLTFKITR